MSVKTILILGLFIVINLKAIDTEGFSSMRCNFQGGSKLIKKGDSKLKVLSRCGEPDLSEVSQVNTFGQFQSRSRYKPGGFTTRGGFGATTVEVEKWHYNCGGGQFNRTLVFVGGTLASIERSQNRGSGPRRCS